MTFARNAKPPTARSYRREATGVVYILRRRRAVVRLPAGCVCSSVVVWRAIPCRVSGGATKTTTARWRIAAAAAADSLLPSPRRPGRVRATRTRSFDRTTIRRRCFVHPCLACCAYGRGRLPAGLWDRRNGVPPAFVNPCAFHYGDMIRFKSCASKTAAGENYHPCRYRDSGSISNNRR